MIPVGYLPLVFCLGIASAGFLGLILNATMAGASPVQVFMACEAAAAALWWVHRRIYPRGIYGRPWYWRWTTGSRPTQTSRVPAVQQPGQVVETKLGFDQPQASLATKRGREYAEAYSSTLVELVEFLAASLVAHSGKRPASAPGSYRVAYENIMELVCAGFEPMNGGLVQSLAPSLSEMAREELFESAYRATAAFLCGVAGEAAGKTMKPNEAEEFAHVIHSAVARRCAGCFGFHMDPQNTFMAMQGLLRVLRFGREPLLNEESPGADDKLGKILNHLSVSPDGNTRYAFDVGSKKTACGVHYSVIRVLITIIKDLQRSALPSGSVSSEPSEGHGRPDRPFVLP